MRTASEAAATFERRQSPILHDDEGVVVPNDWLYENSKLTRAEGDDAADRVVRRDADGHPVAWHDLDAKSPHPTAELRQYLVARIRLDPVQAAAVHGHYRALNVDQIVLAQPSLPFKQLVCHIGCYRHKLFSRFGFSLSDCHAQALAWVDPNSRTASSTDLASAA